MADGLDGCAAVFDLSYRGPAALLGKVHERLGPKRALSVSAPLCGTLLDD
jgi:hypothetical protein